MEAMTNGRHTCNTLKAIRKQIADANEIKYEPRECTHEGECAGTCPACEAEVRYLESELNRRSHTGKKVAVVGIAAGMASLASCGIGRIIQPPLAGIPVMPPEQQAQQFTVTTDSIVTDSVRPLKADEKVLEGIVEESAHFPGGQAALEKYIEANIQIPEGTPADGRVVVSCNVGKDGTISNAKVVKSLNEACDKEALRLVNAMPKWHPGKQLGKAVDTKYTIRIIFKAK